MQRRLRQGEQGFFPQSSQDPERKCRTLGSTRFSCGTELPCQGVTLVAVELIELDNSKVRPSQTVNELIQMALLQAMTVNIR